jgi:hypothetical protein
LRLASDIGRIRFAAFVTALTGEGTFLCIINPSCVGRPSVSFKLSESITAAFPNTADEILSEYARRVAGKLRTETAHLG